ncbi:MAG: MFS transporter [Eubacterium sp.]
MMSSKTTTENNQKKLNFALIMIIYLFGIFMGAIDTSVVTPARVVIQNGLGVNEQTGIWMITIYTLVFASSIPVMGKLADRLGRKTIYLICITLFGTGSLLAGLSQFVGNFDFFLIARAIQAIGGGGIMPIASAEFGTTFPENKRGMALGMVGGVYGIATVIGGSLGSAILGIFGIQNWGFIFFINLPISLFIIIGGIFILPNTKVDSVKKIDIWGTLMLVLMILSLLYGLRNIDFFNLKTSFFSTNVYPFLIVFAVLLPFFILAEKKSADPIINIGYFKTLPIVITLIISFITGVIMMGMVFVPQFAENALKMQQGSGGYFVMILGVFAGIGAPLSGRLIDKFGPKIIMGGGFTLSIIGSLFLVLVTSNYPSLLTVAVSLMLIGLGMGFTMGTPLNYMMLDNTEKKDSNSALASLSLVRSIGTAIAPAIMIGFIAHAGMTAQSNIIDLLPKELNFSPLPYAEELETETAALKKTAVENSSLKNMKFPNFMGMTQMKINQDSVKNMAFPPNIAKEMRDADVTTIVGTTNNMAIYISEKMGKSITAHITKNVQTSIDDLNQMVASGQIPPPESDQINTMVEQLTVLQEAVPETIKQGFETYLSQVHMMDNQIQKMYQKAMESGYKQVYLTTAIASGIALIVLLFYKDKHRKKKNEKE